MKACCIATPLAQSSGGSGLGQLLGGVFGGRQSAGASNDDLGALLNAGGQRNPLDEIVGRLGR